jgi:hypothetical protein
MQKLIVPAAMLLAAAIGTGCAGDTDESDEDQVQQALINVPKGGIDNNGIKRSNDPKGPPPNNRTTPVYRSQFDDSTNYIEQRQP